MNNTVKKIIEDNIDSIEQNRFEKALEEALENGVEDELLDMLYKAEINVPVEQVQTVLLNCKYMNTADKKQKLFTLQYLINKNQIAVFKALC